MKDNPPEENLTEANNPNTQNLDQLSSLQMVELINREDKKIGDAVFDQRQQIAKSIDHIAHAFLSGGRLIYLGAGTSGRLGVLDAVECPPTFSSNPGQVIGLMAGGSGALVTAVEGAEDSPVSGQLDLKEVKLCERDIVVGIAASGTTPYVLGAIAYANSLGAETIGICCNRGAELTRIAKVGIELIVGPEVLSGSTRMKSGTATKMVLNMLSTGAMVKTGKSYGNLMVDLRATNHKLLNRAVKLVEEVTGASRTQAQQLLDDCNNEVKTAIVCHQRHLTPEKSRELLARFDQRLRPALENNE